MLFTRATGRVKTFRKLDTDQIQHSAIVMIGADGTGERVILHLRAYSGDANNPLLSPDGRTIVFEKPLRRSATPASATPSLRSAPTAGVRIA